MEDLNNTGKPLFPREYKLEDLNDTGDTQNPKGKKKMGFGKSKIEIKRIEKDSSRMTTFSKRRKGLFKKADEFQSKTGSKVAILVISAAGRHYTFGDIDAAHAALNPRLDSDLIVQNKNINACGDSSNSGVPSGSKMAMKRWFDEVKKMNVDDCDDIEKLLRLKKQLQEVKWKMIKADARSWTL